MLQAPYLVVVDWARPVRVIKRFAGVAEPEVCCDYAFHGVLAFEGRDLECICPDIMFGVGGWVVLID